MGMDVYGKKPLTEIGEYFRNNVWWWRPLWQYCVEQHPDIIDPKTAESGHFNSGAGLNAGKAKALGKALLEDISNGTADKWRDDYYAVIATLPMEECKLCDTTGIRTDEVGKRSAMDTKELDHDLATLLGRTHGWCNGCNGEGHTPPWEAGYPFEINNVREFAEFLLNCGGFEIY
jgi:hypothetical protein